MVYWSTHKQPDFNSDPLTLSIGIVKQTDHSGPIKRSRAEHTAAQSSPTLGDITTKNKNNDERRKKRRRKKRRRECLPTPCIIQR
jgi:hypothetical protein